MKKIRSERGQSLVELAISLVVILWLLGGAVEFGLAYFQFIQMRDAAQEGALYGSIHPFAAIGDTDYQNIITRVRSSSSSPIDLTDTTDANLTITASISGSGCVADGITVTVQYNHQVFMPFVSLVTGPTIPLTASVTDTILQSTC